MRAFVLLAAVGSVLHLGSTVIGQEQAEKNVPAWKAVLLAQALEEEKPSKVQYVLECRLLTTNGKLLSDEKVIADPRLIISENRPAKIERLSQSPFVTGVTVVGKSEDEEGALQPVITVLDEGFSLEAEVVAIDDQHVQLDASLTLQKINGVEEVDLGRCKTQAPIHNKITRRILRAVRLGEKLKIEIPTAGKEKSLVFEYSISRTGK